MSEQPREESDAVPSSAQAVGSARKRKTTMPVKYNKTVRLQTETPEPTENAQQSNPMAQVSPVQICHQQTDGAIEDDEEPVVSTSSVDDDRELPAKQVLGSPNESEEVNQRSTEAEEVTPQQDSSAVDLTLPESEDQTTQDDDGIEEVETSGDEENSEDEEIDDDDGEEEEDDDGAVEGDEADDDDQGQLYEDIAAALMEQTEAAIAEAGPSKPATKLDPSDRELLELSKQIDEKLEEKASALNLSSLNVKSILHHMIKNPQVISMLFGFAGATNDADFQANLKITRARARQLTSVQQEHSLLLSPVVSSMCQQQAQKSPEPTAGPSSSQTAEDDEDDDEDYDPRNDENDEVEEGEITDDDDDDQQSCTSSKNTSFSATTTTPVSVCASSTDKRDWTPGCMTTPNATSTPSEPMSHNRDHRRDDTTNTTSSEPRPVWHHDQPGAMRPPVTPVVPRAKRSLDMDAVEDREPNFDVHMDLPSGHTRSKVNLSGVRMDELESTLLAHDPDFHDVTITSGSSTPTGLDAEGEIFQQFLAGVMNYDEMNRRMKELEDDDDEQNDPEFIYSEQKEDERSHDEVRRDRATRIPRREVRGLLEDLLEEFLLPQQNQQQQQNNMLLSPSQHHHAQTSGHQQQPGAHQQHHESQQHHHQHPQQHQIPSAMHTPVRVNNKIELVDFNALSHHPPASSSTNTPQKSAASHQHDPQQQQQYQQQQQQHEAQHPATVSLSPPLPVPRPCTTVPQQSVPTTTSTQNTSSICIVETSSAVVPSCPLHLAASPGAYLLPDELDLLNHQFRQHIQLVTQLGALLYDHTDSHSLNVLANRCSSMLDDVVAQVQAHPNLDVWNLACAMDTLTACQSPAENFDQSAFPRRLIIESSLITYPKVKDIGKKYRCFSVPLPSLRIRSILAASPALVDPTLIVICGLDTIHSASEIKPKMTEHTAWLIAWGLEVFGQAVEPQKPRPTVPLTARNLFGLGGKQIPKNFCKSHVQNINYKHISEHLLPNYTNTFLSKKVQNSTMRASENYCDELIFRTRFGEPVPPVEHPVMFQSRVNQMDAPINWPDHRQPRWMRRLREFCEEESALNARPKKPRVMSQSTHDTRPIWEYNEQRKKRGMPVMTESSATSP